MGCLFSTAISTEFDHLSVALP